MKPRNPKEAYLLDQARQLLPKVPETSVRLRVMDCFRADLFRGLLADAILLRRIPKVEELGESPPRVIAILLSRFSRQAVELADQYVKAADPKLGWLVMAVDGHACLSWQGKVREMQLKPLPQRLVKVPGAISRQIFSPNNQWFLKVIMLAGMEAKYWGGPDLPLKMRVSDLARLAGKPQPSASNFLRIAEEQGWLDREADGFAVRRIPQLLEQWSYHLQISHDPSLPVASIYPGEGVEEVVKRLRGRDDAVVGGHAGAQALGLGIANVGMPRIHVRNLDAGLKDLSLAEAPADRAVAILAQPRAADAVFKGAVKGQDGLRVADILQVYLDVRLSMARGEEQAEHIYEQVLAPFFRRRKWL